MSIIKKILNYIYKNLFLTDTLEKELENIKTSKIDNLFNTSKLPNRKINL
jgi:hypothetical protein